MLVDLLSRLPPEERQLVCRTLAACPHLRLRTAESRDQDDFAGTSLLVVERGSVAVASQPPGSRRGVVALARSGESLRVPAAEQQLVGLEESTVVAIPTAVWRSLLARPAIAEALANDLLDGLLEREVSLAQFGAVGHVERVRRKLLELARRYGTPVDGGVEVELPLTHVLLAELVGSARETVSGAVRALEREGFLARDTGRYRVLADVSSLTGRVSSRADPSTDSEKRKEVVE